jgi:NAD(P)-dependent dehydrogenase (short-subunit alcohol dehydrogenase family)
VLVNNAGVESFGPLHELTEEAFDRLFSVNLRGTWLVYKHAVPALIDGGGAIVNIASLAGVVGFPLLGVYSATKAGVVRMTEVMALELRDHGVRANAICPGFIETPMVERAFRDFEAASGMPLGELVIAGQGRPARSSGCRLRVWDADDVIVFQRSMVSGCAGVPNPLFVRPTPRCSSGTPNSGSRTSSVPCEAGPR